MLIVRFAGLFFTGAFRFFSTRCLCAAFFSYCHPVYSVGIDVHKCSCSVFNPKLLSVRALYLIRSDARCKLLDDFCKNSLRVHKFHRSSFSCTPTARVTILSFQRSSNNLVVSMLGKQSPNLLRISFCKRKKNPRKIVSVVEFCGVSNSIL